MVKTKILLSVVIVLLIGVAAAGYQISNSAPKLWQPTIPQEQISTDQSSKSTVESPSGSTKTSSGGSQSQTGSSSVKITSTQAKSIATNAINLPSATAGTPSLTTVNGNKVYIVPIENKGQNVGEIWIDAQTGENIGGAGGAP